MGGVTDEVRGNSKAETYRHYLEYVDSRADTFTDRHPDPVYKKECKRQMVQDPTTGEWVLRFHLHT